MEQITWALSREHPFAKLEPEISTELLATLVYEVDHLPNEIDQFRGSVIQYWTQRALDLKGEQKKWSAGAAPASLVTRRSPSLRGFPCFLFRRASRSKKKKTYIRGHT